MNTPHALSILLLATACLATEPAAHALWSNDFDSAEVGAEPDGLLVQSGEWTVQADGNNKALHLPGTPLETMGVSFGPPLPENVSITARIRGEKKGRQRPSFGVGLGGPQGYRLILAPMRDALELTRGDEGVAQVEHDGWKPGGWTRLKLAVLKGADGRWRIVGKAWNDGDKEPAEWMIETETADPPPGGKASLWGMPYSGLPILYDDVVYERAE